MLQYTKFFILSYSKNYIRSIHSASGILLQKLTVDNPVSIIKKSTDDSPLVDMKNPFEREKKQCILCKLKIVPNYKNVKLLSQFQSAFTGKTYGRNITGLCKKQQKMVEIEIQKAQNAGLMPGYLKDLMFVKDPKLFDPSKPIRPHIF